MTDEQRARARAYYAAHRERKAEIRKACYERHKEKRLAQAHAHYAEHKEEMRANAREYYQRHKEERKAYQKKRYAEVLKKRDMKAVLVKLKERHPAPEPPRVRWTLDAAPPRGRHRTVDLIAFGEVLRRDRQERRAQKEGGV